MGHSPAGFAYADYLTAPGRPIPAHCPAPDIQAPRKCSEAFFPDLCLFTEISDLDQSSHATVRTPREPEHGDYARDLAVVPAQPIRSLPAGTVIRYRVLQVVYGDNASDCAPMLDEREAWAVNPLRVEARVGTVMSDAPPHIRAAGGVAEFTISGGADWMAVKVGGFQRIGHLRLWRIADDGTRVPLHAGDGDPWYISWPDGDGGIGHTFLVNLPEGGGPLRLRVADEP